MLCCFLLNLDVVSNWKCRSPSIFPTDHIEKSGVFSRPWVLIATRIWSIIGTNVGRMELVGQRIWMKRSGPLGMSIGTELTAEIVLQKTKITERVSLRKEGKPFTTLGGNLLRRLIIRR